MSPQLGKPLVLHIRASNFLGGPEKQILGHIKKSTGYRHAILTFIEKGNTNEFHQHCELTKIPLLALATSNPFNPLVIWHLRRTLREVKPAIICTHGYKPIILTLVARIGLRMPVIAFARGHTIEGFNVRLFQWLERLAFHFVDRIVAVSYGYAEFLVRSRLPRDRIRVIQNAIDVSHPRHTLAADKADRHTLGYSNDDLLVAAIGRLSAEKGFADLIRGFAVIKANIPRAHLLIIGDGPLLQSLQSLAGSICPTGIRFLGFRKDIGSILSMIDLFMLPSHSEGLPNVLLEACAAARPVVATCVGGVPEVIQDGINGLLVSPGRPDLLARAAIQCLESSDLRCRLSKAAFETVASRFSTDRQSAELESTYCEVLSRRSSQ
jgi:glycosyltransferase involved in cell wall biosynthesis